MAIASQASPEGPSPEAQEVSQFVSDGDKQGDEEGEEEGENCDHSQGTSRLWPCHQETKTLPDTQTVQRQAGPQCRAEGGGCHLDDQRTAMQEFHPKEVWKMLQTGRRHLTY